ncbi:MAG: N-acetylmuramoyl-L-alanine amidase [Myxococcales bacterium]|nr:N-acetylmuramoyl-L-alanine amidase [Myxococcales bacterium]
MFSIWSSVVLASEAPPPPDAVLRGDTYVEQVLHLDLDSYDDHLEQAVGRAPQGARRVVLETVLDGRAVDARSLLRDAPEVPSKEGTDDPLRPAFPVDVPGSSDGFLSGRAVYVSQCHGWIWSSVLGRFALQRGNLFSTVEDFHNPEGTNQFLLRYLENAGARVFTARERDRNPRMVIADNDGAGYSETGSGFADGEAGFADDSPWAYGEDPFDAGTTRTLPADGGATARWQPEVTADGHYVVYVSWDAHPTHATDAHYRITHPGGTIDRWFDQTVHGSTWQYVERLWLTQGSSLTVELIGDSAQAGALLSADAVRIGGGVGDVQRQGETSGRPRWEGGAIQYVQFNGAPPSVYDPFGDGTTGDGGSDPSARSRWAEWEHPAGEDAVYLSWHSNASGGAARGTVVYEGGSCATAGSATLAARVQDEIVDMAQGLWEPAWNDRGVGQACFSEIDASHNDEMPAVLVELAFHDNEADAGYLKHPLFRDDASRAMYRGIVRYFAERDGITPTFLPEPPTHVSLVHADDGGLLASWEAPISGAPFGDPADSYVMYRSSDGLAWDSGTPVDSRLVRVPAEVGEVVFVRIAAVNAGGTSFPSEVVGAMRSGYGTPAVLVVGAFDRVDRGTLVSESVYSLGTIARMDMDRMNRGDIVATHGRAIAAAGYAFDSASDEALDALSLDDYAAVVWATGEESTIDETFDDAQQAMIRSYLDAGGALWTSGAEILWDLDERGSDDDRAFASEVLGATLADDMAATTMVNGVGALAGVGPMDFSEADGAPYPVEYPDVLASDRDVVAQYADGTIAGVLGEGVALFGFPFDAIGDAQARVDVAGAVLDALLLGWTPPTEPTSTPPTDPTLPTSGTDDPGDYERVDVPRGCGCSAPMSPHWTLLLVASVLTRRRTRKPCPTSER